MEEVAGWESRRLKRRDSLSAVSFGVFLFLVGAIFVITPNLCSSVVAFFQDFRLVQIAPSIWLPAPVSNHPVPYLAIETFCYLWGLFQVAILVLRFSLSSPLYLKAKMLSRIIFWFGAGWLLSLLGTQVLGVGSRGWFAFWSVLVILLGLSLVIQATVLAVATYGKTI